MQNCAGIRTTGPPLSALTAQLSGVQGVDLIFLYHLVHCCITAGITTLCDEGDRKNILLISNRYQGLAKTATLQFNKRAVWSTEELERKSHFSTHKRDFTEGWMQSCGTPALHSQQSGPAMWDPTACQGTTGLGQTHSSCRGQHGAGQLLWCQSDSDILSVILDM